MVCDNGTEETEDDTIEQAKYSGDAFFYELKSKTDYGNIISYSATESGIMLNMSDGTGYYIEVQSTTYTANGYITEIEPVDKGAYYTVTIDNGNEFTFYSESNDWFVDTIVTLTMDSNGTEDITDDVIVNYNYTK